MGKKRRDKGSKKPKQQCHFVVKTSDLNEALSRISSLMGVDGIPMLDQFVAFRTDVEDGKLFLECGRHGTYVRTHCPAEIKAKGMFVTNIAIPWGMSFGAAKVEMEYDPKSRAVNYKAGIRGNFQTTGKFSEIEENRVDPGGMVGVSFAKLHRAVNTALFNADKLEEQEDVLVLLSISEMADDDPSKGKSSKIKRKKDKGKKDKGTEYVLRAVVFDRLRAAIVEVSTRATAEMPMGSFGSGHVFTFLQKCSGEERKAPIAIKITEDYIALKTDKCLSVTPYIENKLGDQTALIEGNFDEKNALFSFTLDTEKHQDPFINVLSVQGGPRAKLSSGSDETASNVLMTVDKSGKITLEVNGSVAQGKTRMQADSVKGSGKVTLKGTHIVESMSLVSPAKVEVTVWPEIVRQVVVGQRKTVHWFGTVDA